MAYTIEKIWDENERVTEASNGRIYVSTRGRWQWLVLENGVVVETCDIKREALETLEQLKNRVAR
jgi:hypothetical protein